MKCFVRDFVKHHVFPGLGTLHMIRSACASNTTLKTRIHLLGVRKGDYSSLAFTFIHFASVLSKVTYK